MKDQEGKGKAISSGGGQQGSGPAKGAQAPPPPPPPRTSQDIVEGNGSDRSKPKPPPTEAEIEAILNASRCVEPQSSRLMNPTLGLLRNITILVGGVWIASSVLFPKYEYRVESISDSNFKAEMDKNGIQGWELAFARRASDGSTYSPTFSYEVIFKRKRAF